MSNLKFYTMLNLLNILIILFLICSFIITAELIMGFPETNTKFICGVTYLAIYIVLKWCLPKIFVKIARKYKNSIIGKFALTLKNKSKQKWKILLLAFCYDIPFILFSADIYKGYNLFESILTSYLIFYAGGVFLFYIMLYMELKKL